MTNYNNESNPEFLNDYLIHIKLVQMLSERTIQEYYFDIRLFLKYIHSINIDEDIENTDISTMSTDELKSLDRTDLYNFIFYASDERNNQDYARYRKVSSLRSFFKYLLKVAHIIDYDVAKDLDDIRAPKPKLPKYLSLDESLKLLESCDTKDSRRDFCIITLFINCGMRLSELVGINVSDIDFEDYKLKVLGKGNKERIIYLNEACIDALKNYLEIRNSNPKSKNENALFLSNQNKRISKRRVQQIVENALTKAGLNGKGITTHKLRHTAATLMYQYGDADAFTLKELLGHSSISTTEIYTHLNDNNVRSIVENNPLSHIKSKKNNKS